MINTIWLNTFCTLIDTGHFTRTADKLAMTQPGVSQHIQKLEDRLGQKLLYREGKSFSMTPSGEIVYRQGHQVLTQLADLCNTLQTDTPFSGRCRIASPGSVGLKLYTPLLDWQQKNPAIQLDYTFAPNRSIIEALEDRRLDIGLVTSSNACPGIGLRTVAHEQLILVTSSQITQVDWPHLLALGYINHPDGAHHANLLLGANYPEFQDVSQLPHRGFSNQISQILEPVTRNLGFTILPEYAVNAFTRQEAIQRHCLKTGVEETLYLATRQREPLPARIHKMVDLISEMLKTTE